MLPPSIVKYITDNVNIKYILVLLLIEILSSSIFYIIDKLRFVDDSACGRQEHLSPASCPGSSSYRYQQLQQPSSLHGTGDSGPESYEEETETTETRVVKKKRSRR